MAPRTWRLQEYTLLVALCETEEGRQLLARATDSHKDPWWVDCRNYWTRKYNDEFPGCFPAETEEEFEQRKKLQPRAKTLVRFPEETELERADRLEKVRDRIGTFLKGLSPNRTPRTQKAKDKKKKDNRTTARSSSIPVPAAVSAPSACTNATSPSSVSPLQPAPAANVLEPSSEREYAAVQDLEQFARAAKRLEHAIHDLAVCPSVSREDKLQIMISLFKRVAVSVAQSTGWVGWFPIGGVDEYERIVFEHPCTAFSSDGLSFESYLARQLGWSVDRLSCTFDNFTRGLYDPPQSTPPESTCALSPAQMPSATFVAPRKVASPVPEVDSDSWNVVTPPRLSRLPRSASATLAPHSAPLAMHALPAPEAQSPSPLVAAPSTQKQTSDASREPAPTPALDEPATDCVKEGQELPGALLVDPPDESPTIFQANEREDRRSPLTQQMMDMVDKLPKKSGLGKRSRRPTTTAPRRVPKTPTPPAKKAPQAFPMNFSRLHQSSPTPDTPSPLSGKKDAEIVVKIEPGTFPPDDNARVMPQSLRAPSVISLSSDSEVESPVKSQATTANSGRPPSVISLSSDSEDESPPKKMRKPTLIGPSQSDDAATSLIELSTSVRAVRTLADTITSPTASDFASNSSNKENTRAAPLTIPASHPSVLLHAPIPADSSLPQTATVLTPRTMARIATLSVGWHDGKPPTLLADVNEQAIEAMRKTMGHILQGTVVAQPMSSKQASPAPHTSWVEGEYPLHLPRLLPEGAMKEESADSQGDDSEGSDTSADAMDAEDEQGSPSVKSSTSTSSSDGDWLIEMWEDTPFPGVWSFEVHPSLRELRDGPLPKFHMCARWLLKIVIWFRVDLPPAVKMITLDEATYDLVLNQYFITRRVFDTTGIHEFRLWNRSSMDWKVCRPYDKIPVSITDNHTLLIRLPRVNNPVGFSEILVQAMGPCTNVDHTRYSPHSRKGKARAND